MAEVRYGIAPWETTVASRRRVFDIPYAHSIKPSDPTPVALNLNGIGEGLYSASVSPAIAPNVVSPVLPLRDPHFEITPVNLERLAAEVPSLMAEYALRLSRQAGRVDMMARSQGGAVGIQAVTGDNERFGRVGLIMPFGLNRQELGANPRARRHNLLRRLAQSARHAELRDPGHWRSTAEIARYMARSLFTGSLMSSLDAALEFDENDELAQVAETHPTTVFFGQVDMLFPASEVEPKLSRSIQVIHLPGGHATPGSRIGREQIAAAYSTLRAS